MTSRRVFLKNGAFALVSLGFAPSFLARTAFAAGPTRRSKQLIAIFQRGAVDGLNIIVPYGEAEYYRDAADDCDRAARTAATPPRSISTGSSDSIRGCARSSRSGIGAISPSCTRAARPTPRDRISTLRTTWRRHARRQEHRRRLAEPLSPGAARARRRRRRFARSRSRGSCRACCRAGAGARDEPDRAVRRCAAKA